MLGYVPGMSTDNRESITGEIEKGAKDVRDTVSAGLHHSAAEAERARRDANGDEMTADQKIASGANEAKQRIQEGVDNAKRHVRDNT